MIDHDRQLIRMLNLIVYDMNEEEKLFISNLSYVVHEHPECLHNPRIRRRLQQLAEKYQTETASCEICPQCGSPIYS
ncbi:MAG TPA: hypothetical protein ENK06_10590 [Gammaproteobacteria bacterium]|nr:hypothetical protein [Gammaproteobacteria bacterium]